MEPARSSVRGYLYVKGFDNIMSRQDWNRIMGKQAWRDKLNEGWCAEYWDDGTVRSVRVEPIDAELELLDAYEAFDLEGGTK